MFAAAVAPPNFIALIVSVACQPSSAFCRVWRTNCVNVHPLPGVKICWGTAQNNSLLLGILIESSRLPQTRGKSSGPLAQNQQKNVIVEHLPVVDGEPLIHLQIGLHHCDKLVNWLLLQRDRCHCLPHMRCRCAPLRKSNNRLSNVSFDRSDWGGNAVRYPFFGTPKIAR